MAVTDTLRELREQVEQNLSEMKDTAALDALRVKVLGKKGTLTERSRAWASWPRRNGPRWAHRSTRRASG